MQSHEYRVVPAPRRGLKAKGTRRPEDRFALALETEMNRLAREGWEFVRTDTLPCERRRGWFGGRETVMETLLVFRRPKAAPPREAAAPVLPPAITATPPLSAPAPAATRTPPAREEEPLPSILRRMEPGSEPDRARHAAE
ncbi:DUF4177 domain-containing protein [Rubellimicrobium roseum]|uniref:DUF4177 domain-containing protein n=1 Tax=Rubellimicrobium roseum TaxID=687525 RepID=UPI00159BA2E5|nr:DUF4177 domain-containing protein [Rubellimicrobium roseum]